MASPRPKVKVTAPEGLSPERQAEIEAQFQELMMKGRPHGQFAAYIRQQLLNNKRTAPTVIADPATGTLTIPATFEGVMALIASFDSILLPEELKAIRDTTEMMVPMGIEEQAQERMSRAQRDAEHEHMKAEHPDEWDALQGWRV